MLTDGVVRVLAATGDVLIWLEANPCPDGRPNADLHRCVQDHVEVAAAMRSALGKIIEEEGAVRIG
jgi:hypothetical protein